MSFEIAPEWVHVQYPESAKFTEVYGFSGSQGMVNCEGLRFVPKGRPSKTLAVYMHPSSTLQLLPMPPAMARAGVHVLCAGSRFAKNDTPLIMEKVALDLGAYLRHAKEKWGYRKIVLCGWSGGGSLALFYQAQAEKPTLKQTPAGDPIDLSNLIAADAMIFQAAHLSRARMLSEWIDPSVTDEADPDRLDLELDIYNPKCPQQPPYSQEFIGRFRAAQLARMRKRTAWVKDRLHFLGKKSTGEAERSFVTYRTMADLRFMDPAVDPNAGAISASRRPPTPVRSASGASRRCAPGCRSGRSTIPMLTGRAAPAASRRRCWRSRTRPTTRCRSRTPGSSTTRRRARTRAFTSLKAPLITTRGSRSCSSRRWIFV